MSYAVLIIWVVTALVGMYLLTIFLIEYDSDYQRAAATRLPIPVLCGHVLLALGGLGSWVLYVITDRKVYCWAAAADLAVIATLGFIMAIRWLGVYRAPAFVSHPPPPGNTSSRYAPTRSAPASLTERSDPSRDPAGPGEIVVPPERHFPVPLVIGHGIFAVTTVTLVVLTVLGLGGS